MSGTPRLSDGVIALDAFTAADVEAQVAGEDQEHARRFGWHPDHSTPETVAAAVEGWTRDWEQDGPTRAFAMREASSGELAGGCQLRLREKVMGELSYWTFPHFRGRGFATRAVRLLVAYAFEQMRLERIEVYVEPDNLASRRVAEGAGFVEEGLVRRRERPLHGERRDMVLYGLLPGDVEDGVPLP